MSILIFEPRTPRSLEAMYCYLTDSQKTDLSATFGLGLNPVATVQDMTFIQYVYHQYSLEHPYIQIIFSFDRGVSFDTPMLKQICMDIGSCLIIDDRQVFGAIHYKNTDKVHCHYLINYVGINGNLYRQQYSVIFYKTLVNEVLLKYGLAPIKFYGYQQLEAAS